MENKASLSGLRREDFQKKIQGKDVDLFFLRNENGMEVAITNYGGSLVAIMVPDKNGNFANVIQGHDNIDDCVSSPEPFLSTLVGRYGNRIAKGRLIMVLITSTEVPLVFMPASGMQNKSTTTH